jgi:hypothetical protein
MPYVRHVRVSGQTDQLSLLETGMTSLCGRPNTPEGVAGPSPPFGGDWSRHEGSIEMQGLGCTEEAFIEFENKGILSAASLI